MTFERARELAQALQLREQAAVGLQRLLFASDPNPPEPVKSAMRSLGETYLGAQEAIERIVSAND